MNISETRIVVHDLRCAYNNEFVKLRPLQSVRRKIIEESDIENIEIKGKKNHCIS